MNSPSARTRRWLTFGPALAAAALAAGCSASSTSSASAPASGPAGTSAPAATTGPASTAPTSTGPAATSPAATGNSTPSGTSNPAAAGSGCSSQDLRVGKGTAEGAAGSVYQVITFTNAGSAPCTLQGYPGVSLASGSPAAQVGAAADRQSGEKAAVVTLQPQGVASATLRIVEAQNFPASKCNAAPTTSVKVYPPNQTVPLYLSYQSTGCTDSATHLLTVTTVVPGSAGGQ